ncbi:MAG: HD domain-containing protein [Bacillota bacterium]|nr:HD domain-containing protein [Bacillota bacterium]MDI7250237.1 HD domain-containing protein [Bacillota bacterium]
MADVIIRDPVHGDVAVSVEEAAVLDTWPMQRLRGIKQVGTAYLVYPGCTHTRFDHCLGTLAVVQRLLAAMASRGYTPDAGLARLARMTALVHDITHLPFGHTFEDETRIFPRHDTPARFTRFLREGPTGGVLRRLGLDEDVCAVLSGDGRARGIPAWVGEVVAGAVDADLLDYVRRDAYYAGLRQAYDDRIFAYFGLTGDRLTFNLTRHGMVRPDARSELSHLLRLRYFLTERLYQHHAKIAAGAMVARAVELATRQGLTEEHLYDLTDETLLYSLPDRVPGGSPHPGISFLLGAVRERRLYKRAYVLSLDGIGPAAQQDLMARFRYQPAARRALEEELARAGGAGGGTGTGSRGAGVPAEAAVIVYCPEATAMKEAAVPVLTPSGLRHFNEPDVGGREITCLDEMYRHLWRFYIFAPAGLAPAVGRAAEEALGFPNEHLPAP